MALVWIVGTICAVLAFVVVRIGAKLDERDFYRERGVTHPKTNRWKGDSDNYGMQWAYGGVVVLAFLPLMLGLMSTVLHAGDVPVGDPCSYLEPWSWEWLLIGCLWGR